MLRAVIIGLIVGATFIIAGQVGDLIQFQPNTTAKSSEVNENFNRIKDAVNDNYSRIQNLQDSVNGHESRIRDLEGFKNNISATLCNSNQVMRGVESNGNPVCGQIGYHNLYGNMIIFVPPSSCTPVTSEDRNRVEIWGKDLFPVDSDPSAEGSLVDLRCPVIFPRVISANYKVKWLRVFVTDSSSSEEVFVSLWKVNYTSSYIDVLLLTRLPTGHSNSPGFYEMFEYITSNNTLDNYSVLIMGIMFSNEDAGDNLKFHGAFIGIEQY